MAYSRRNYSSQSFGNEYAVKERQKQKQQQQQQQSSMTDTKSCFLTTVQTHWLQFVS